MPKKAIIQRYSKISNSTTTVGEILKSLFGKEVKPEPDKNQKLIKKNKNLISKASKKRNRK